MNERLCIGRSAFVAFSRVSDGLQRHLVVAGAELHCGGVKSSAADSHSLSVVASQLVSQELPVSFYFKSSLWVSF